MWQRPPNLRSKVFPTWPFSENVCHHWFISFSILDTKSLDFSHYVKLLIFFGFCNSLYFKKISKPHVQCIFYGPLALSCSIYHLSFLMNVTWDSLLSNLNNWVTAIWVNICLVLHYYQLIFSLLHYFIDSFLFFFLKKTHNYLFKILWLGEFKAFVCVCVNSNVWIFPYYIVVYHPYSSALLWCFS